MVCRRGLKIDRKLCKQKTKKKQPMTFTFCRPGVGNVDSMINKFLLQLNENKKKLILLVLKMLTFLWYKNCSNKINRKKSTQQVHCILPTESTKQKIKMKILPFSGTKFELLGSNRDQIKNRMLYSKSAIRETSFSIFCLVPSLFKIPMLVVRFPF